MVSKQVDLPEAVAEHVRDGDVVFVGGFGQCIPFAAGHELIRQGRKDLTLCRSGADILFDQLIEAGCASKVIFGYLGNPGIGISHAFNRAVREDAIAYEDWTNFAMVLRLHAGALGIPFIPAAILLTGDMPGASIEVAEVVCPYTGERLSAIPALNPDVALVHAQRADEEGNVQMWGLPGDTVDGANASRKVIVTVEEIVDAEVLRADPNRTILPSYRVTALAHVPWGAHPSYVQGYYGRDDDLYFAYDKLSRSPEELAAFLDNWVHGVPDREAYLKKLGSEARRRLTGQSGPVASVSYGFEARDV
jgi:glutaconate CoA-transferase subunit A